MRTRLLGVVVLTLLLVFGVAGAAAAVEAGEDGHGELPSMEEIGSGSETSQQFYPDEYEPPSIINWLLPPLLGIAVLVTVAMLLLYLWWQPRFAREREERARRRRR